MSKLLTGHQLRKRMNFKSAAVRDREHMDANPIPDGLNNRATDIRPTPPARQQNEFTISKALSIFPKSSVDEAVLKEITKCFTTYKSLRLINFKDLEKGAIFVRSQCIIRDKLNNELTARIPVGPQPEGTYNETFAGTTDANHRQFALASAQASAAHRGKTLNTGSCDIPAAFLNGNKLSRNDTNGKQLYTRLPNELPEPYGGALAAIDGSHYGLRQANHIYDQNLIKHLKSHGYTPSPSHPYTFTKDDNQSDDPGDNITVEAYVDDFEYYGTSQRLIDEFESILSIRYGKMKFNHPSLGLCGQALVLNPDNSIKLHYGPYLKRVMTRIGMDKVPAALSPDVEGLFDPSTDPTPLSPSATSEFRTVNGELIHVLPGRHDIKKVVTYLLSKGENPDNSDYLKQFHLLRYLKGTLELGPTFSADPTDYPNGAEFHSSSDIAANVHPNGQTQGAGVIIIGTVGARTSPCISYSAPLKGIQLSPTESEYTNNSKQARINVHYRQYAKDLGHPQIKPTIMLTDNASAIKLTEAPLVPTKSNHISLKVHYIRHLHKTKQIRQLHQGTCDIITDGMTKHVGPSRFLWCREKLFTPYKSPILATYIAYLQHI